MDKINKIIENQKHYSDLTLPERMQQTRTPAISIALIENYSISSTYTFGNKSRSTCEPVTDDTLFQAASISKPIFAAAVMRLAENGVVDLNEDIHNYLTDYIYPTYDGKKHKVTIKQLLSHYAGFNVHGFRGYKKGEMVPTIDQILNGCFPANSEKLRMVSEPGAAFLYSGGGYILAQKIIVDLCNKPFTDIIQELVLSPFLMVNSSFEQPLPNEKTSKIASGYDTDNLQLQDGDCIMPELSAAGLWSTPTDLALFGIEIMSALKGDSKIIEKYTADLMTKKVCDGAPTGIGFFINTTKNGIVFGHDGYNCGYISNMRFCPANGTGIVAMQNKSCEKSIVYEVTNSFKDVYGWE